MSRRFNLLDGPVFDYGVYDTAPAPLTEKQAKEKWMATSQKQSVLIHQQQDAINRLKAQLAAMQKGADPSAGNAWSIQGGEVASGGYRSSIGDPWLTRALMGIIETRQVCASLTPLVEIVPDTATALFHGYSSLKELVTACYSAVQGAPGKVFIGRNAAAGSLNTISAPLSSDVFAVLANAGTAVPATTSFGWRLRLTGSLNNWAYRPIQIQVGIASEAAGVLTLPTPLFSVMIVARRLPADIILLSPGNAAGLMTVVPGQTGGDLTNGAGPLTSALQTIVVRSIGDANSFAMIESLNARDLISRSTGAPTSLEALTDAVERYGRAGGDEIYAGIRDAE